jgi:hypothetical protein
MARKQHKENTMKQAASVNAAGSEMRSITSAIAIGAIA